MDLADAEFNETPGQQLGVTFNPASAEQLFAGSGHTFAESRPLAKTASRFRTLPCPFHSKPIPSSSPKPSNLQISWPSYLVPILLSRMNSSSSLRTSTRRHRRAINGDRIYNGAMDDGSGSALVMDIASNLKAHPEKIQRSILFLLVTAEEKGLLGSKYFAAHPTVPAKSIVADVNVDMFLPIVPLKILKIEGIEESDLGTRAAALRSPWASSPSLIPSRCATHLFEAINTASSRKAFLR